MDADAGGRGPGGRQRARRADAFGGLRSPEVGRIRSKRGAVTDGAGPAARVMLRSDVNDNDGKHDCHDFHEYERDHLASREGMPCRVCVVCVFKY